MIVLNFKIKPVHSFEVKKKTVAWLGKVLHDVTFVKLNIQSYGYEGSGYGFEKFF